MSRLAQYLVGSLALLLLLLVSMTVVTMTRGKPAPAPAPSASASASAWVAELALPPPLLPFPEGRVDLVPERRVGLRGIRRPQDEGLVERGTVWAAPSGRGFGRHVARSLHLLADPEWILVQADSGLWLLEAKSLARRARLRTGAVSAVAVSTDGRRIAYAEYTPQPDEDGLREGEEPAELVVLEFPSLLEVHRSRVMKPVEVRFSPDARTVASAAKNGATVVPLDGRGAPWTTKRAPNEASDAIAVVPLDDTRVAYLTRFASLIIQDRGAERFEHQYPLKSTDLIFIKITHTWSGGDLHYDAVLDRVLSVQDSEAVVVDAARTESPRLGHPIDVTAGPVDAMRPYALLRMEELARRFPAAENLSFPSDHVRAALGARGDAYFLWGGAVVRLERDLALRSPDFDDVEEWESSQAEHDIVFTTHATNEMVVRRVSLDAPALDITPERLGAFAPHHGYRPFLFENGDRVFPIANAADRGGIVRLPRGGSLQPIVWFDAKAVSFSATTLRAEGRFAFVNPDYDLVEVAPEGVRVLGRIGFGAAVSWNAKKKCWEVKKFMEKDVQCTPR
ncbi:hypothetical protein [Polyangium sp. y55x31]|uniref:hypothetical protein n=1 Tax=Polyangium sp. y55x31 TaxID=3042688 RepID=UPI002482C7B0|nr:hypothetical protein [Polyangium sp. y55x31]MDI1478861.1 hypothetical protein [Polyangium sp. y55x31]